MSHNLLCAHTISGRCGAFRAFRISYLRSAASLKGSCPALRAAAYSTETHVTADNGLPQPLQNIPQPLGSGDQPADNASAEWLERTRLLVGDKSLKALEQTHVLLVGLGGVGSFAAEFLCRAGIGHMTIIDGDDVDVSNKNRQLHALTSTVNQPKAEIVAARLMDINPSLNLSVIKEFLQPGRAEALVTPSFHYVMDCIDSIAPKVELIAAAHRHNIPVISAMGAGGRVDPSKVRIADISQTFNDPFASEIRRSLKKKGIHLGVTVVFSEELALRSSLQLTQGSQFKRSYFGTISYIPALFGLNAAAYVINDVVASSQGKQSPNAIKMNREHRRKALGLVNPHKKKKRPGKSPLTDNTVGEQTAQHYGSENGDVLMQGTGVGAGADTGVGACACADTAVGEVSSLTREAKQQDSGGVAHSMPVAANVLLNAAAAAAGSSIRASVAHDKSMSSVRRVSSCSEAITSHQSSSAKSEHAHMGIAASPPDGGDGVGNGWVTPGDSYLNTGESKAVEAVMGGGVGRPHYVKDLDANPSTSLAVPHLEFVSETQYKFTFLPLSSYDSADETCS